MSTLTGPRAAPRSGQTKSLVILLHGYGADGNDLFGLSGPLAERLPDTAFRSPNAPERCRVNPMVYQWFPISWLDGSAESEMAAGFHRSAAILDTYITEAMAEEGVGPEATALLGFSQGGAGSPRPASTCKRISAAAPATASRRMVWAWRWAS